MTTPAFRRLAILATVSAVLAAPLPSLAQSTSASMPFSAGDFRISTVSAISAGLTPIAAPSREIFQLSRTFIDPGALQPYGVVDQNNVRQSRYTDPMHCNTNGLLTPMQMEAAWQACSDRFYHVDHSG